uniref:Uncharacterized protein n=1 Tax=uncultured prokaryote TaxID=198431 RepID=A0A0H5QHJ0_9ZZZZ|nr:hypothetical protein [uncultured prokaryote]
MFAPDPDRPILSSANIQYPLMPCKWEAGKRQVGDTLVFFRIFYVFNKLRFNYLCLFIHFLMSYIDTDAGGARSAELSDAGGACGRPERA